jgi:hypothetical protein
MVAIGYRRLVILRHIPTIDIDDFYRLDAYVDLHGDAFRKFDMTNPRTLEKAETFVQFWRHYLLDHAKPGTRALHFLGTGLAVAALIVGIVMIDPMIVILGIALGYLFSWSGHFLIEHNRPSMVSHPVWSFQCDVRMFRLWLGGRLNEERIRAEASQHRSKAV